MRLYTKAWVTGQLTDAQWEAVAAAGAMHSFELGQTLPASVLALSTGDGFGGFHDAVLISAVEGPTTTLEFCTGDLQRGYFTVTLVFSEAEVATRGRPLRRVVRGLFTELLYDELDIVGERFEWRAIYSDYNVVRVRFAEVNVSYVPRPERYWGRRGPSRWEALLRGLRRPFVRTYWAVREWWWPSE